MRKETDAQKKRRIDKRVITGKATRAEIMWAMRQIGRAK